MKSVAVAAQIHNAETDESSGGRVACLANGPFDEDVAAAIDALTAAEGAVMPRLSSDKWEQIRAEREAGASFGELAKRHSVSVGAIHKRAKAEGWGDGTDVAEVIRRKVNEKVNGIVNAVSPKKRAEAIDAAADRSAEVIKRHQDEVNAIRERLYAGLKAHRAAEAKEEKQLAFEDLKAAKIASETLLNIHKAERQAWGLDVDNNKPTIVIERSYGGVGE